MRILVKSSSSSVPTTRRIYSGNDHRYAQRYPYNYLPLPPPPPATPLYYSPSMQQHYHHHYIDPYRTLPSFSPLSNRYPYYSYQRFPMNNRTLSQRLWDMDSEDDQDEYEDKTINTQDYRKDLYSSYNKNIDQDEQDISDNQKLVFI